MKGSKKRNRKKRKKGSPSATFPVQKQGESKEVQTELSSGVENGSSEAERVLLRHHQHQPRSLYLRAQCLLIDSVECLSNRWTLYILIQRPVLEG